MVNNFVMSLTLRHVEARPNQRAENGSRLLGKGQQKVRVPSSPRRSMGAM